MAKKVFTKKMVCISIAKQANRGQVALAEDVSQNEKGTTARNVVSLNFTDPKEVNPFEVNATYTIEISL